MAGGDERSLAEKGVDAARAAAEVVGIMGSKPRPRVLDDPKCQRWMMLEKKSSGGYTFYKMPSRWPRNNVLSKNYSGNWVPEPVFWMGLYDEQMRILDEQISKKESEIKVYTDEINRIKRHVLSKEVDETQKDVEDADIQDEIDEVAEQINQLRARRVPTTNTRFRLLMARLIELQKSLGKPGKSKKEKIYMDDWEETPGAIIKKRQNLYLLIRTHKSKVTMMEKTDLDPLKDERDLNDYWFKKWKAEMETKYK